MGARPRAAFPGRALCPVPVRPYASYPHGRADKSNKALGPPATRVHGNGVSAAALGSRADMFRHRRVRVACVLLVSWAALTAMGRWSEHATWPRAILNGLLLGCVVAGTWWFAEMTQGRSPRRRDGATSRKFS